MNDGYDYYCIQIIEDTSSVAVGQGDDVACACAAYLSAEGHEALSSRLIRERANALAIQTIPTTNNINEGDK